MNTHASHRWRPDMKSAPEVLGTETLTLSLTVWWLKESTVIANPNVITICEEHPDLPSAADVCVLLQHDMGSHNIEYQRPWNMQNDKELILDWLSAIKDCAILPLTIKWYTSDSGFSAAFSWASLIQWAAFGPQYMNHMSEERLRERLTLMLSGKNHKYLPHASYVLGSLNLFSNKRIFGPHTHKNILITVQQTWREHQNYNSYSRIFTITFRQKSALLSILAARSLNYCVLLFFF